MIIIMNHKTIRNCSNCAAYELGQCQNGIGDGAPDGRCDQHLTREEDRGHDRALDQLRAALDACHLAGATYLIQGAVHVWLARLREESPRRSEDTGKACEVVQLRARALESGNRTDGRQ
jgi:hypothetical protein